MELNFFETMGFVRQKIVIYIIVFLGLLLGIYNFWGKRFYASYMHYKALTLKRIQYETLIDDLKLEVMAKKYFIKKLMTDPGFREHVAHEQAGFLRTGEYVIRFKDNNYEILSTKDKRVNF